MSVRLSDDPVSIVSPPLGRGRRQKKSIFVCKTQNLNHFLYLRRIFSLFPPLFPPRRPMYVTSVSSGTSDLYVTFVVPYPPPLLLAHFLAPQKRQKLSNRYPIIETDKVTHSIYIGTFQVYEIFFHQFFKRQNSIRSLFTCGEANRS